MLLYYYCVIAQCILKCLNYFPIWGFIFFTFKTLVTWVTCFVFFPLIFSCFKSDFSFFLCNCLPVFINSCYIYQFTYFFLLFFLVFLHLLYDLIKLLFSPFCFYWLIMIALNCHLPDYVYIYIYITVHIFLGKILYICCNQCIIMTSLLSHYFHFSFKK